MKERLKQELKTRYTLYSLYSIARTRTAIIFLWQDRRSINWHMLGLRDLSFFLGGPQLECQQYNIGFTV